MASLVRDVMTENVVAVRADAEFKELVEVMRRHRVSAFPVLDDADRVVGVVSESDLLVREVYPAKPVLTVAEGRNRVPAKAEALTAAELMTSPAVTVTIDASITDAARIMYRRKVNRLPVVDSGGRLAGIVSRSDLLGVYDRPDGQILDDITEQVLAGDFAFDPGSFEVTVTGGVVTLAGAVASQAVAISLLQAVWEIDGVVYIRDRLTYPLTSRVIS